MFGSWENGWQEKEVLNNSNNMRKPTSQLLKHKCYNWETDWSGLNGPSPLGIWAKWIGSIYAHFYSGPFLVSPTKSYTCRKSKRTIID